MTEYTEAQLDNIDRLVAQHVMGWKPNTLCDYPQSDKWEVAELPNSSDGWYCRKCGYVGEWEFVDMAGYQHDAAYPQYTRSWDAAGMVFEACEDMTLDHWTDGTGYMARGFKERYWAMEKDAKLAVCLAALRSVGVD